MDKNDEARSDSCFFAKNGAFHKRVTAFCISLRTTSIDAISFCEGAPTSTATTLPSRRMLHVVLKPVWADDAGGIAVEQVRSPSVFTSICQPFERRISTPFRSVNP